MIPVSATQPDASTPWRWMGAASTAGAVPPPPDPPERELPDPGPPTPPPPGPDPPLVTVTRLASPLAWTGTASASTARPARTPIAHFRIMPTSSPRFHRLLHRGRASGSPAARTRAQLLPGSVVPFAGVTHVRSSRGGVRDRGHAGPGRRGRRGPGRPVLGRAARARSDPRHPGRRRPLRGPAARHDRRGRRPVGGGPPLRPRRGGDDRPVGARRDRPHHPGRAGRLGQPDARVHPHADRPTGRGDPSAGPGPGARPARLDPSRQLAGTRGPLRVPPGRLPGLPHLAAVLLDGRRRGGSLAVFPCSTSFRLKVPAA